MPFTLIPTTVMQGPYPTLPVAATSLDISFTPADNANGNYFVAANVFSAVQAGGGVTYVGGDVLVVQNTTGGALAFSITSQPDSAHRVGDVTSYSVSANTTSVFNFSQIIGWANGSNNVYLPTPATGLNFAVLQR